MPTPMPGFVRALKAYDPTLRARWATHSAQWFLEKKCEARLPSWLAEKPSPWHSPRGLDLWEGWKEGYVHVLSVPKDYLAWSIVEPALRQADLQAHGTAAAMNRALDQIEEEWEAQTDRAIDHFVEAATSEAYDRIQWLDGNRVAVTSPPITPPGEQREGYIVKDRRVHAA